MNLTRRELIAAGAVTAGSYKKIMGANNRLRIGVIGCGGMATGHMRMLMQNREVDNIEIAAVCDVYQKRLDAAAQLTNGRPFKDYRSLLAQKDIDYVLIATPEHWHFQMTMDAADARKHIYCEKPMTQNVEQARQVPPKIKATGVKMQVGVQGMSDDSYEAANKALQDGLLGKVVVAQIDYSRNHVDDFWKYPEDDDVQPGVNLDWNAFLGSATKRPFDRDRFFSWRRYWDYSSGIASDLFVHRVTRIIKSLGLTFPEYGVGMGGKYEFTNSTAEIPDTFNVILSYPGGPDVLLVSSMANDTPVDHVLRGHKATLEFTRTGWVIRPQGLFEKEGKEIWFHKTGSESTDLHHRNLQNAIRNNEPLNCDCTLGYYGVVACEMGVKAFRQRRYMKWDAAKERIIPA